MKSLLAREIFENDIKWNNL